jgi:hypothetical protein
VIGTLGRLAGQVPEGLDSDQAQTVLLGLLALCVVGLFVVVRTVQKATTRLVLIGLLVAVGASLWVQRENLQDCAGQCECHVFGRDVRVPDPDGVCR